MQQGADEYTNVQQIRQPVCMLPYPLYNYTVYIYPSVCLCVSKRGNKVHDILIWSFHSTICEMTTHKKIKCLCYYAYMYTLLCTGKCMSVCVSVCLYEYVHKYVYIKLYVHVYIGVCVCINVCVFHDVRLSDVVLLGWSQYSLHHFSF